MWIDIKIVSEFCVVAENFSLRRWSPDKNQRTWIYREIEKPQNQITNHPSYIPRLNFFLNFLKIII